jgi:hypothetical protein
MLIEDLGLIEQHILAVALAIVAFVTQVPVPVSENNMYVFKQNQWIREQW